MIILGSEEPSNDQRCGAVGRHSVSFLFSLSFFRSPFSSLLLSLSPNALLHMYMSLSPPECEFPPPLSLSLSRSLFVSPFLFLFLSLAIPLSLPLSVTSRPSQFISLSLTLSLCLCLSLSNVLSYWDPKARQKPALWSSWKKKNSHIWYVPSI